MKIRLASPITVDSIVDGPGMRAVIWTQGCTRNCPGCHNKETHSLQGGFEIDIDEVKAQISRLKVQKGITISGGEPFLQSEQCAEIAKHARSLGLDVWCYTGFNYDELSKSPKHKELLKNVDVLVDGPFMEEYKSFELKFKGSKNQRSLHLKEGEIIKVE